MSRHRYLKNINIEEELESDEDRDYFGRSVDEEPLTPSTSRFMYQREPADNQSHYGQQIAEENEADYNDQEAYDYDDDDGDEIFDIDDVSFQPKSSGATKSKPKQQQPAAATKATPKKATFIVGGGDQSKSPKTSKPVPQVPAVENLRVSESKKHHRAASKSPARMTPNTSFHQLSAIELALNASPVRKVRRRQKDSKSQINFVIAGHVDAGKSTLMGHLLYLLGYVDEKTMSKYKQQSNRLGKGSFAFAWILDDTEEERTRGVTMDIAHAVFETPTRRFNILDAPGHRDFIPNMISGAAQADAALLVVNASRGEFETGFDLGGQTREHALLLRSLGVQKMLVAVNKMDSVEWSRERFEEIEETIGQFLRKQAGFPAVRFVPVSGLGGENIVKNPDPPHPLMQWYKGPSLVELLDTLDSPARAEDKPLRVIVNDVYKCTNNLLTLYGLIEAGSIEAGDKVFVMPRADPATVKSVAESGTQQQSGAQNVYFAGDQVVLTLSGSFEADSIYPGHVICQGGSDLLVPSKHFLVKLILFDDALPILKGTRAELFAHALRVPCTIVRLCSILNKQTGEVVKKNPRVLTKGMSAVVELLVGDHAVCIEPYARCKALGRLSLRINGRTMAAGVVEETLKS